MCYINELRIQSTRSAEKNQIWERKESSKSEKIVEKIHVERVSAPAMLH